MKRDNDLIRRMLLVMEEATGAPNFRDLEQEGISFDCLRHHCLLLKDAGLATGPPSPPLTRRDAASPFTGWVEDSELTRLTWAGHEFLAASRDPKRWSAAMQTVKELGGAVTFAGVKAILTVLMEKAIGVSVTPP